MTAVVSGVLITTNPFDNEAEYYLQVKFNSLGTDLVSENGDSMDFKEMKEVAPFAKVKLDTLVWEVYKII